MNPSLAFAVAAALSSDEGNRAAALVKAQNEASRRLVAKGSMGYLKDHGT